MSRRRWIEVAVTIGVLSALSAVTLLLPVPELARELQQTVAADGATGPLLFAAALVLSIVIPPLPTRPLTLSAGALFDPVWGLPLVLAAQATGAAINFLIARAFGKRWLRDRPEFRRYVEEVGVLGAWQSVVLLRMFAGFTFDWYSYFAGLLRIRFRTYLLATVAGTAPRTAADVFAGNFLSSRPWLTLALGVAVTAAGLVLIARHPGMRGLVRSWKRRPSA